MSPKKAEAPEEPAWPPLPPSNPDLLGHREAEQTLIKAFHSGRMAHAWMITGPKGIGKATLAYRFARYVLSQRPIEDGPGLFGDDLPETPAETLEIDPDSPVFQRVSAGSHGDLLRVERTVNERGKMRGEVVVDDVREVGEFLSLTSSEGGWRIVIVDSADEMNRSAANALLKVLEEPPGHAMLLLVSHNPGQLLPTIRSRCRMLKLETLSADHMDQLLGLYAPDLDQTDRVHVIELSDGSIGDAMGLIEAGGLELYRDVLGLLSTLPELSMARLHGLADKLSKAGAEDQFTTAMELLQSIFARFIRFQAVFDPQNPDLAPVLAAEKDLFNQMINGVTLDRWLEVWEKVGMLLERTGAVNLDRKQVVLNVFLEFDAALKNR